MRNYTRRLLNTYWRHKLYTSIDELPVYNWVEIHATGDINLLVKQRRFLPATNIVAQWQALYNEFYTRFGKTKEFLEYLKKQQKLTIMLIDNALEFDSARDIHIKVLENDLQKFTDKGQAFDFYENCAVVSKFIGGGLMNPKTVTVSEYYGAIKLMEKQAKEKEHGKGKA